MPWDKLSFEIVTSTPKKKYKHHLKVLIIGLEDKETNTHLEETNGGDDEKLQPTTTQANSNEEFNVNIDKVIEYNVQVEPVVSTTEVRKLVVVFVEIP